MKNIAITLLSAFLGAAFTSWFFLPANSLSAAQALSIPNQGQQNLQHNLAPPNANATFRNGHIWNAEGLTPDEAAAAMVYDVNNRSVANIATRIGNERFLFRDNPTEDAGSGFVLDSNGHIMTNNHVIEGAVRILVTLYNGETFDARPVGVDPINDIAILKIDALPADLVPVQMADSSALRVGMKVFAIGNPFGLHRTMTTGIVSSLNRTLPVSKARSIKSVIQIDAAINPGNSGGPLLDSHGRLIGMNTAIASRTGQNSGIGFAIPSNLLQRVIPELLKHGRVLRPDTGIAEVLQTDEGLRVLKLDPEGPAARAGILGPSVRRRQSGIVVWQFEDRSAADLIVGVNGRKTVNVDEFLSEIESHRPGDTVTIHIVRNEQPMKVQLVLAE
ncbi:MAG: trypsin-like peptidase domain-containing protein [Fuerstiella sp.]